MIKLGIITGTRGVDGGIFIKQELETSVDSRNIRTVNIGFSEKYSKLFHIRSIERLNKGFLLKIKNVLNKEEAEKLKEQAVFVSEEFIHDKEKKLDKSEIIGYKVYDDSTLERIGTITDILSMPANELLVIKSSSQEVLIPFMDEYVSSVDKGSGKIFITVIPGLIEINEKELFREDYE